MEINNRVLRQQRLLREEREKFKNLHNWIVFLSTLMGLAALILFIAMRFWFENIYAAGWMTLCFSCSFATFCMSFQLRNGTLIQFFEIKEMRKLQMWMRGASYIILWLSFYAVFHVTFSSKEDVTKLQEQERARILDKMGIGYGAIFCSVISGFYTSVTAEWLSKTARKMELDELIKED